MTDISQLVEALGSGKPVEAYHAQRRIAEAVNQATDPRKTGERSALSAALVAEVTASVPRRTPQATNVPGTDVGSTEPKHPAKVRRLVWRFLCQIADDKDVPALTAALDDLEVRDAVRGVLESIPTLPATVALVAASRRIGPEFQVGVLNALGKQRWREALALLERSASDPDPVIRLAAIEGLANFPEDSSDKLIAALTQTGSPPERARAQKARIRLAETLFRAGEKRAALTIYHAVAADPLEGPWTKAAKLALQRSKS